jgi:formylmethanofuran dehydrogenase subunit D
LVLLQGGRLPGSSKKAAAAVAGTSKPRFKSMPATINVAVEKVLYLQAELLSALVQIE